MTAREHYATLLANVYRWSVSGAGDPYDRAAAWLARTGLDQASSYLDLGAGFGAHTIPLARAGKEVTAVDFDQTLLSELSSQLADSARVHVVCEDFVSFLERTKAQQWQVVLCLGDTLTHLADAATVRHLFAAIARVLPAQGRLVLSYRDYTRAMPEDLARFIPVRSDATRNMHCLIEALDEQRLRVTDIVTDVLPEGPTTRFSSYQKLRLAPAQVATWAREAGLCLASSTAEQGLVWQQYQRL